MSLSVRLRGGEAPRLLLKAAQDGLRAAAGAGAELEDARRPPEPPQRLAEPAPAELVVDVVQGIGGAEIPLQDPQRGPLEQDAGSRTARPADRRGNARPRDRTARSEEPIAARQLRRWAAKSPAGGKAAGA